MDYNGQKRESSFRSEMRRDQRDLYSSAAVDDDLQIKSRQKPVFFVRDQYEAGRDNTNCRNRKRR